jgi:hypothetical protein
MPQSLQNHLLPYLFDLRRELKEDNRLKELLESVIPDS